MLDSMVRKRHNRAAHRGVVTIRVEEDKTVMEGEGTPNRGALIRYTAIIQEKLSVLQKLDDQILDFKSSYQWAGGDTVLVLYIQQIYHQRVNYFQNLSIIDSGSMVQNGC